MIYIWLVLLFLAWLLPAVVNYSLLKALIIQEGVQWTNATRVIAILLSTYSIPLMILLMIGVVFPIQTIEEWLIKPVKW